MTEAKFVELFDPIDKLSHDVVSARLVHGGLTCADQLMERGTKGPCPSFLRFSSVDQVYNIRESSPVHTLFLNR